MTPTDQIKSQLDQACSGGRLAGLVAYAATSQGHIFQHATGKRQINREPAMTDDSVFWIASMTKAVTGTAAMQLVEQGKLSLDQPVGTLVPHLANPLVLDGSNDDGSPKLRPATRPVTLRNLLTHTSGYCYDMWNGDFVHYLQKSGKPGVSSGRRAALDVPLANDPGTRWEYGIGIDQVGLVVEAASGMRLADYMQKHIFAPLGMVDTSFTLTATQRERLVGMHARGPNGVLTPIPFETVQDPEVHMGGGGLYSTAPDYIRFMQMILNKGSGNSHKILKPETIALMSQNHIGELSMTALPSAVPMLTNNVDLLPGIDKKWGLTFMINTQASPEGRSAGSLAWAGLGNTYYWIDPSEDIAGVILMQLLPFADKIALDTFAGFERGVYDMLGDATKAA